MGKALRKRSAIYPTPLHRFRCGLAGSPLLKSRKTRFAILSASSSSPLQEC
jgi:hypothetical protein